MIKKKVCMLGSFGVGKTSLTRRFVDGSFSEKYQTTIGVKIDQKIVSLDSKKVNMMIWDIHGQDDLETVKTSYIRNSSGVFLVIDITRENSAEIAWDLYQVAKNSIQDAVVIVLFNKMDLIGDPNSIKLENHQRFYHQQKINSYFTCAKTGENVDSAFTQMASLLVGDSNAN